VNVWNKFRSKLSALNPFRRKSASEVDQLFKFLGVGRSSGDE
jgi:hypothetical protein